MRHLVRRAVVPAFREHLDAVPSWLTRTRAAAAEKLFDFNVLDPACGSAHFLVAVVDELADLVAAFLAQTPLPAVRDELDHLQAGADTAYGVAVEDVALLRRLVLKRCVYGVDLSPMGAEIAKVSLWLASFVPGLSLTYLEGNIQVGNSLLGVGRPEAVRQPGEELANWRSSATKSSWRSGRERRRQPSSKRSRTARRRKSRERGSPRGEPCGRRTSEAPV